VQIYHFIPYLSARYRGRGGGGPRGPNCQWLTRSPARPRWGKGRGSRGDQALVLTGGGEERERPVLKVNAGGLVRAPGAAAVRRLQHGRRSWGTREGRRRRRRARARPPLLWGRARGGPAQRRWRPWLADGPGGPGRPGTGAGGLGRAAGSAQSDIIVFFRIYF
jgi:hypothetical protein